MTKEQRKNEREKGMFFTFVVSICLILLIGCPNPLTIDDSQSAIPDGKGSFSLKLSDTSRTIMPATPGLSDFAVYTLIFTPINGGNAQTFDRTNANLAADSILLEPGIYYLTVNAYKDNGKTRLMARGTSDSITITAGVNTNANVVLKPLLSGGTGTFHWNIVIPLDVSSATIAITPGNEDGTAEQTVYLSQFQTTGNRTLKSGTYNLLINLEKPDGRIVVWHSLLYVYQNLESVYNYTFTESHFGETNYKVTFNYNNGSAAGTESVLHGDVAVKPDDPARANHIFRGWFTDNGTFANPWDFSQPVINSVTLYAKWEIIGGINMSWDSLTLTVEDTKTFSVFVAGVVSNNVNVTWSSSNPDVVSVNNGFIHALSPGFSYITATRKDNGETANCYVRVFYPEHSKRYQAIPYTGNDKIKYSYTYDGYDFYYIYLGELSYIPMYTDEKISHSGSPRILTFSQSTAIGDNVKVSISESSMEAKSIVESHTNSTTTGGKVSVEAGASFWGIGAKAYAETTWSKFVKDTTSNAFHQATSLTNTREYGYSRTTTTARSDEKSLNQNNRPGFYRYTMFSSSDVYLYIVRNKRTNEFSYEFIEHVIPDSLKFSWDWDFCETGFFGKTDDSSFNIDISILDSLPEPEYVCDIVKFHTNSSVPGTTNASPKEIPLGQFRPTASPPLSFSSESVSKSLPAPPTRPEREWSFLYWNTEPDGSGTIFNENTPVTGVVNVYAQWGITYYENNDIISVRTGGTGHWYRFDYVTEFDIQKLKTAGYSEFEIRLTMREKYYSGAASSPIKVIVLSSADLKVYTYSVRPDSINYLFPSWSKDISFSASAGIDDFNGKVFLDVSSSNRYDFEFKQLQITAIKPLY